MKTWTRMRVSAPSIVGSLLLFSTLGFSGPLVIGQGDAHRCELYVEAFGEGTREGELSSESWIEAYLSVQPDAFSSHGAEPVEILQAGMYVEYRAPDRTKEPAWLLGVVVGDRDDSVVYKFRFVLAASRTFDGGRVSFERQLESLSFYVDVRSESGQRQRYWLLDRGRDFSFEDIMRDAQTITVPIDGGEVRYLRRDGGSPIFDRRNECL